MRLRRINRAFLHFEQRANFLHGRILKSGRGNFTDVVYRALIHHHHDVQVAAGRPLLAHIAHGHVDVTVILVKLADALQILLQLCFIQPARFIDETDDRSLFRLHLLAQYPVRKMRVALEIDEADRRPSRLQ